VSESLPLLVGAPIAVVDEVAGAAARLVSSGAFDTDVMVGELLAALAAAAAQHREQDGASANINSNNVTNRQLAAVAGALIRGIAAVVAGSMAGHTAGTAGANIAGKHAASAKSASSDVGCWQILPASQDLILLVVYLRCFQITALYDVASKHCQALWGVERPRTPAGSRAQGPSPRRAPRGRARQILLLLSLATS